MPFEIVEKPKYATKPKVAADEVWISTRPKPGNRPGRLLVVKVGVAVARSMRWTGPEPQAARVSLAWGSGPDLGKLRIAPHATGSVWDAKPNRKGTWFKITSAAIPEDMPCRGGDQKAFHEVVPGKGEAPSLIVKLPASVWKEATGAPIPLDRARR